MKENKTKKEEINEKRKIRRGEKQRIKRNKESKNRRKKIKKKNEKRKGEIGLRFLILKNGELVKKIKLKKIKKIKKKDEPLNEEDKNEIKNEINLLKIYLKKNKCFK